MLRWMCGAGLALAGLFFAAGLAVARGAPSETSGLQIVYASFDRGKYRGTIMNADGSDSRSLVFEGKPVFNFACSPDGGTFAFAQEGVLRAVATESGALRVIAANLPTHFIEFSVANGGARVILGSRDGVRVVGDDGLVAFRTRQFDVETAPALSPDGGRFAYSLWDDGRTDIYLAGVGESEAALLVNGARGASWSPDGGVVAYASPRYGDDDVFITDVARAMARRLTHHPATDYNPAWSPDGGRIVFVSYRDSRHEIYLMKADGSAPHRLTHNYTNDFAPCFLTARPELLVE
jgi:Tol biopolymer transport system component